MLVIYSKFLLYIKYFLFLVLFTNVSFSVAEELLIKKINVTGEKRLSESFILNFLPDLQTEKLNDETLNKFTKDLYNTGLFSTVNLNIINNVLEINVKEFPIINDVSFVGNDLLNEEELTATVNISPRDIFNKQNVTDAVERIKNEYQRIGRYLAEINAKKVNLSEGRVNIIFEITEGTLLTVKNVNFIGNKFFSDNELKSKISTKEDAWYKLFGSNKFIPERMEYDKEKLKQFYNERGFVDFKVNLARGDLLPNFSGFNLNFVVNEGPRYLVNKVSIKSLLINEKKQSLINNLSIKKGEYFDSRALESSIKILTEFFENAGYNFITVSHSFEKNKNILDIKFTITEGDQKYINKINIIGNTRTSDEVIRRELSFFEGDPFNKNRLVSSINSIKRLGFFQFVKYRLENSNEKNSLNVVIEVKETNTGSVSFGVGYSTLNNTSVAFGLTERNFLGNGNKVNFQTDISDKKSTYNIGMTEPYFLDRPLSSSFNIFNMSSENTKGDIKSDTSGFDLGLGIKKENFFQKLDYNYSSSETTTSASSTSLSTTGEEGVEIITSSITYSLSEDTTDSFFNPTSGYNWKFTNTLAGLGGDASFLKSIFKSKSFYPINYGDFIFGFKTGAGFITALDDKITSSNRFYLGGKTLRGFDNSGVGPRDTGNNQSVGGNNFYNFSIELKSDEWMPDDTGFEWFVFSDIGSIWGTDYETGVQGFDDSEPRITNGFGLSVITPVGPLQVLWGFPIQSESYDLEENFQFSIGTRF